MLLKLAKWDLLPDAFAGSAKLQLVVPDICPDVHVNQVGGYYEFIAGRPDLSLKQVAKAGLSTYRSRLGHGPLNVDGAAYGIDYAGKLQRQSRCR
jgi:hypothetical protein